MSSIGAFVALITLASNDSAASYSWLKKAERAALN